MIPRMAALPDSSAELVALGELGTRSLDAVLGEACEAWLRRLHWDYTDTAELIRSYAAMRALEGLALVARGEVAGYCYWVHERAKSLVGDLFVRASWRTPAMESLLLRGALAEMRAARAGPGGRPRRVEAQLMQTGSRAAALLPEGPRPRIFPRLFMLRPGLAPELPPASRMLPGLEFFPWEMRWKDAAAALIADVYAGHVDSEINDQYRSRDGAARFLQNIVQFPGCGVFIPQASWIAAATSGELAGLALATRVSASAGHVAQLCLQPAWRGSGLGYDLLRRSLAGLRDAGLAEVSLTVTEENHAAVQLYERTGFHAIHRFEALVWDEKRC